MCLYTSSYDRMRFCISGWVLTSFTTGNLSGLRNPNGQTLSPEVYRYQIGHGDPNGVNRLTPLVFSARESAISEQWRIHQ